MKVNEQRLNEFVEKAVNDLAAGYGGVMVGLGHKMGLYRAHGRCRSRCGWMKIKRSKPFAPAKASVGTSTTSGYSRDRPLSIGTVTEPVWYPNGFRPSKAWRRNSDPALAWLTLVAVMVIPQSLWPRPSQNHD